VSELPLSLQDIKTVMGLRGEQVQTIPSSSDGRKCILTPSNLEERCTWRREEICKKVPRRVPVPVFGPKCISEGQGSHVSDCKVLRRTEPLVHKVRLCTTEAEKSCSGPCYNCPSFCQPARQMRCETTHQVTSVTRLEKRCNSEEAGEDCREVSKRVEEDVVEEFNSCQEMEGGEMCATINCKFVNETEKCTERETTSLIQLSTRECTMCQPSLGKKVEVGEQCTEVATSDCAADPLKEKWRKFCEDLHTSSVSGSFQQHNPLRIQEEQVRSLERGGEGKFLFSDILDKSLSPVNDLVIATLRKITVGDIDRANPIVFIPTDEGKQNSETPTDVSVREDKLLQLGEMEEKILKEEMKLLEKINDRPTNINLNVKYVTTPPTVRPTLNSVYFDPLIQLIDTQIKGESKVPETTTQTQREVASTHPLTSDINNLTNDISRESTTKKSTETEEPNNQSNNLDSKQKIAIDNIDHQRNTPIFTTDSPPSPLTTPTATVATDEGGLNDTIIRNRLSAADYLKLCFTSGQGCNFSLNKNDIKPGSELEEESKKEPEKSKTVNQHNSRAFPKKHEEPKSEDKERLEARVKLCFFSGICNDEDVKEFKGKQSKTITLTTTTTKKPKATKTIRKSNKKRLMEERIRMRAYLCFSEGKCS